MPCIPTGAYHQPTAYSRKLTGILNGFPLFHNVQKA